MPPSGPICVPAGYGKTLIHPLINTVEARQDNCEQDAQKDDAANVGAHNLKADITVRRSAQRIIWRCVLLFVITHGFMLLFFVRKFSDQTALM